MNKVAIDVDGAGDRAGIGARKILRAKRLTVPGSKGITTSEGKCEAVEKGATDPVEDTPHIKKLDAAASKLEKSIRIFRRKLNANGQKGKEELKEMVSRLEEARQESLNQKRSARREAWNIEVKQKMEGREEFQRKTGEAKDKLAMSKISMEWREELKDEMTTILFKEVFPQLHRHCKTAKKWIFIDAAEILSCRSVCKEWKSVIEARLSEEFTEWKYYGNFGKQTVRQDLPWCSFRFSKCIQLERFNFWSKYLFEGSNPFFSRKLEIGSGDPTVEWKENIQYWKEMEKLLRKWGKEFWQVNIQFDKGTGGLVMYELLVKYLKFLPNLRFLGLYPYEMNRKDAMHHAVAMSFLDGTGTDGRDWLAPMKDRMARNPFPELPHLKHLLFDYLFDLPVMRAALSKYGPNLESIYLKGQWMDPADFVGAPGTNFPCLKRLTSFCELGMANTSELTFNCPMLERTWMIYEYLKGADDLRRLFQNVNSFGASVKWHVMVWTTAQKEEKALTLTDELFLELPKMETLYLCVARMHLTSIDFLLPCVGLKELTLAYQKIPFKPDKKKKAGKTRRSRRDNPPVPSPAEEIIQYSEYRERIYESNIWKLLPELRRISIDPVTILKSQPGKESTIRNDQKKVYTREGYLEHCGESSKAVGTTVASKKAV